MLDRVRRFFRENLVDATRKDAPEAEREHALRLATTALLMEVSRADYEVREVERAQVLGAVRSAFGLGEEETRELVEIAEEEAAQATSLYEFTRLINDGFDHDTKPELVLMLWQVAFADGHVDKYEEHLIRRIADLIHVPHRSFIAAKHEAAEKREAAG